MARSSTCGLPATITAQAGTVDAAGNQVNLAGSADVVIDTEAGTVVVRATMSAPPSDRRRSPSGSLTMTVPFSEARRLASSAG